MFDLFRRDLRVFKGTPGKKTFLRKADLDDYSDHVETEIQIKCPGLWLATPSKGICLCGDGSSMNGVGLKCIKSITPTVTEKYSITCGKNEFSCKSGDECIDPKFICDGSIDCTDGSDEQEAPEGPCPKQCDFKCDGVRCLNKDQRCDGVIDCIDESDEKTAECHSVTESDDYLISFDNDYCDEFLCDNGNCVVFEQRCDSKDNCGDNSDEINCPPINIFTNKTIFDPDNDDIIVPDEDDDQDDPDPKSSKEQYAIEIEDCHSPDYFCVKDRSCIPVHQLCDGIHQCSDGSDESGRCSERLCDHFTECQFFCHDAPNPNGFVCYCPQHLILQPDGRSCAAPEVCEDFSTCSHICEALNPTKVKCKCFHGYKLKDDNFTCESIHDEDPIILFSNRHVLRGIRLNKKQHEVKNYYSTAKNLIGLDFYYDRHSKEYSIVWSDITKDVIFSGKFHNDELVSVKPIIESDLSTTEAVAIDWIGKNLYWIDSSLKQIEVATKDGMHRTTLISENIAKPRSMAIDSRFGFLFWSDWEEDEPRIERATLAGEDRKAIFNLKQIGGAWPNGISLDYIKKRVFFLDARSKEIHTIDYNGEKHKRILRSPDYLHHAFALTIYENNVFWTDWRLGSVIKADKFTGSNITLFYQSSTQPFDVKVMAASRQPWDFNGEGLGKMIISPCEKTNCSHLCLLSTNNTFKCACPHMMRLNDEDHSNCEKVDEILFYITDKPEIRAIELKHPYSNAISTIYHLSEIMAPNHIAIHPKDNRIFWTDVMLSEIKSVKLSTSVSPSSQKIQTILDASIDKVHAFAIDWMSELMYFSQHAEDDDGYGNHRLLVSNLNGEYLSIVLNDINPIYSLIVSSENRKIYYATLQNENGDRFAINECNMDGSDDINLILEDEIVESLSLQDQSLVFYQKQS
jgi:low-density lipoprotein receptor-related protein 1 (alpha-2-macroglobulin receptor)